VRLNEKKLHICNSVCQDAKCKMKSDIYKCLTWMNLMRDRREGSGSIKSPSCVQMRPPGRSILIPDGRSKTYEGAGNKVDRPTRYSEGAISACLHRSDENEQVGDKLNK